MKQEWNRDKCDQYQYRGDVQRKLFSREQVQRSADNDKDQRNLDSHEKLLVQWASNGNVNRWFTTMGWKAS
jgi:hypothetical protein